MDQSGEFPKKVDENWKQGVEQERSNYEPSSEGAAPSQTPFARSQEVEPEASFGFFLSSLSMQAMVALGELPNPATRQTDVDLNQARYVIDVMGILQEKTKGNLTQEETGLLEGLLYELRTKYVAKKEAVQ